MRNGSHSALDMLAGVVLCSRLAAVAVQGRYSSRNTQGMFVKVLTNVPCLSASDQCAAAVGSSRQVGCRLTYMLLLCRLRHGERVAGCLWVSTSQLRCWRRRCVIQASTEQKQAQQQQPCCRALLLLGLQHLASAQATAKGSWLYHTSSCAYSMQQPSLGALHKQHTHLFPALKPTTS